MLEKVIDLCHYKYVILIALQCDIIKNVQYTGKMYVVRSHIHTVKEVCHITTLLFFTIYCSVSCHCYATTARWADIPGPFLGNGSVNTFPLLGNRFLIMQQLDYNSGRAVFSAWFALRGYKWNEVWSLVSWTTNVIDLLDICCFLPSKQHLFLILVSIYCQNFCTWWNISSSQSWKSGTKSSYH
jgi:hypothetical protein